MFRRSTEKLLIVMNIYFLFKIFEAEKINFLLLKYGISVVIFKTWIEKKYN